MKIGIPKALLYFRYHRLWEAFFDALQTEYVVSADTNKQILAEGTRLSIDEACLSSKIFMGHVQYLLDKCDAVLIPRIGSFGRDGTVCTRFQALYDLTANTFPQAHLLALNMESAGGRREKQAFLELGASLGKSRAASSRAYRQASSLYQLEQRSAVAEERKKLLSPQVKILVVAHHYNIFDRYVGAPILDYLKGLGAVPVLADVTDYPSTIADAPRLSETLPWEYNRHLTGAVWQLKDQVDGILMVSSFPCGPDSMINEILTRRVHGIPMMTLVIDGQEGTAGMETRLESFLDIIHFKQGGAHGEKRSDVPAAGSR